MYLDLQVQSMTSESSALVDKRIISKLLVTYFERGCARDVLTLMARMLVRGRWTLPACLVSWAGAWVVKVAWPCMEPVR